MNRKPYIFLIEDDEVLGGLLANALVSEGYEVGRCRDGEEGWQSLQKREPDLLLLDIVLPSKSGYEILEDMNKIGMLARVPAIIISNSGEPVQVSHSLALGVQDYLVKADLSVDEVLAKVKKYLSDSFVAAAPDRRLKVLMAEDDTFLQSIAEKVIGSTFDVRHAADGTTVLTEAESFSPDAILLDTVLLSGMSGLEVLEQLRKDDKFAETAIIMFTNTTQEDVKKKALALGADGYVVKADLDIISLERLILEQIAKKHAQKQHPS